MLNFKNFLLICSAALLFSACTTQQELDMQEAKKSKKVDFLMETKDINNIKRLEVSNNLIQILPVINISGIEILVDENTVDQKPILFRNDKCIFMGAASADPTTNRVDVKLTKATCRTSIEHKVNYEITGWALGADEVFGLKAKKTITTKELEDDKFIETKTLYVKKGSYSYLYIDMVKQLETLIVKDVPKTDITQDNGAEENTKIMRIQR